MPWTQPSIFAPGQDVGAAILNTYVKDNTDYLIGPRTWTAVTFHHSFADFGSGFAPCAYRRVGDQVHIRGLATHPAANPATNWGTAFDIFTLPAGFRPLYTQIFTVLVATGGVNTWGRVDITTAGAVSIYTQAVTASGVSLVQLDGLFFDQVA